MDAIVFYNKFILFEIDYIYEYDYTLWLAHLKPTITEDKLKFT